MGLTDIGKQLTQELSPLFTCSVNNDHIRIRTPFLYPDGDVIDLFCRAEGDIITISDLGETARWLRMQTFAPQQSLGPKALLEDICLTHGVEFQKDMLQARCWPGESLAAVVLSVGQAAVRVADLSFSLRTHDVKETEKGDNH